jgi:heavy metal translocating P-type ATPase
MIPVKAALAELEHAVTATARIGPPARQTMAMAQPGQIAPTTTGLGATLARGTGHSAMDPVALLRMAVAAGGAAWVWFALPEPWPATPLVGLACLAVAALPVLRTALANLLSRRMTMELSMSIAVVAAAAIGETFTALIIALFVLVAEELEDLTVARGHSALRALAAVLPATATVRRAGALVEVPVGEIATGETVLVLPGERIAVDGTVIDGRSDVDEARITGESMPVDKGPGAVVYAGSVNLAGSLDVAVTGVGRQTSYGRIVQAIEDAEHQRAPVQRLADRMAGYLVYTAFAAAALTWLLTGNIRDTISVVIVAGACGIAAGTPLAILGAVGRAARMGAVIKGGVHVETLGRVDTIILDKTGTLTFGTPEVDIVEPAPGIAADDLLATAGGVELHSEHPLATAIVRAARARGLTLTEPDGIDVVVGRGVRASVAGRIVLIGNAAMLTEAGIAVPDLAPVETGSQILVARDGDFLGRVIVADPLRPEARPAMQALAAMGLKTMLLSGDNAAVVARVGRDLGLTETGAGLLPQDKFARVDALIGSGRIVAMVGDGINDSPALSRASVGIAMGSGTDIAQDSADVVLIGNDLMKLVGTIRLARRTRAIIWQNFGGTLAVDAVGIGLAAFGWLNPMIAAFIHVGSELLFLANAARLLPRGSANENAAP